MDVVEGSDDTQAIDAIVAVLYGEGDEEWDADTLDNIVAIVAQVRELPKEWAGG